MNFDETYTHIQAIQAITWVVQHNMSKRVVCDVYFDIGGLLEKVIPKSIIYIDDNTINVIFSTPQSGRVKVA